MAKDDWILSSEHPEEQIINMIKAKSNLNLNMHEPVNNFPDGIQRYAQNRSKRTSFGDKSVTVIKPSVVSKDDFPSTNKNTLSNRNSFSSNISSSIQPKTDGLSFRRETLEMKHQKRMLLNNSDVPIIKTFRDRSNNSSPSSVDFDDRYTRNELLQHKRRTIKSKNHLIDDSVSEMSDMRKKSIDDSEIGTLSRGTNSKYLPVKYPDSITREVENNKKVRRSNSHYVTTSSNKHHIPVERRRSDDLASSSLSLNPYRHEVKKEKKLSPMEKVKQFFNPKTKRKKLGDSDHEKESVMSSRHKDKAALNKNTKIKRTASSSDSENVYRKNDLKSSTRHLNGKGGWSSYGESEEENIRRNGIKYRDEVDDSSANESGIRHWKNDVYLHTSAVGDIPVNQSTIDRNKMRKAKSREELSSSKASLISPARKTLSRSISVLSPWTPRLKKYKNDINYDSGTTTSRPPRSPKKPIGGSTIEINNDNNKYKNMNGDINNKGKKVDYNKKYSSGTLPNPKTYSEKTLKERNHNIDSYNKSKLKFVGKSGNNNNNYSSKTYLGKSHESLNSQDYNMIGNHRQRQRKTMNSESSIESSIPDDDGHKVYTIPIKHQSGILRSTTIPRNTRLPSRS